VFESAGLKLIFVVDHNHGRLLVIIMLELGQRLSLLVVGACII